MNATHDEILATITVPEYRELTSLDYLTLLYASIPNGSTGHMRLSSLRFATLEKLGFVRKATTFDEPRKGFVSIVATTEGREAASLYLQQMLVAIDRFESKVRP